MAHLRRRNGEHIGPKVPQGRLIAFPRCFRFELEAIPASRRDLAKMTQCHVSKP